MHGVLVCAHAMVWHQSPPRQACPAADQPSLHKTDALLTMGPSPFQPTGPLLQSVHHIHCQQVGLRTLQHTTFWIRHMLHCPAPYQKQLTAAHEPTGRWSSSWLSYNEAQLSAQPTPCWLRDPFHVPPLQHRRLQPFTGQQVTWEHTSWVNIGTCTGHKASFARPLVYM